MVTRSSREAPTGGSVILAGVLLKLGTYGFIRFSLPCSKSVFFSSHHLFTQSLQWVSLHSFTAIRQTDFKRIIAYIYRSHESSNFRYFQL
jgi:NADH:ubiquinone oxidoreductase subunit 4 (subunit M)